tara:strand:- start:424 stop:606 length:183 start_codon:yes stop_codon:yes gene_type:complete
MLKKGELINIFKTLLVEAKNSYDNFKGKKIKIGRARIFEDKTKDLDNLGMYALSKLTAVF